MENQEQNEIERLKVLLAGASKIAESDQATLARIQQESTIAFLAAAKPKLTWSRTRLWASCLGGAAVAATLIFAIVSWSSPRAYALADIPIRLRQAKTLHWKVTRDSPTSHTEQEYWLDLEHNRYRTVARQTSTYDGKTTSHHSEVVLDNGLSTLVDYDTQSVYFNKPTPLYQQMMPHQMLDAGLAQSLIGDPTRTKSFALTGQEILIGVKCDVWKGMVPAYSASQADYNVTAWLTHDGGEIQKIVTITGDQKDVYEPVERNPVLPDGLFQLDIPATFAVKRGSKQDAPEEKWGPYLGTNGFEILQGGVLPDGSVIFGFHFVPKSDADAAMFSNLKLGEEVPHFCNDVNGITTIGLPVPVGFKPLHLAWLKNGAENYEWCLFVPGKPLPGPDVFFRFAVDFSSDHQTQGLSPIAINNAHDFDAFVRGIMAEWSDGGAVPAEITYDRVTKMATQNSAGGK